METSTTESSNDDPNNITNILALVISVLDWLKNAGKTADDLKCPEACKMTIVVDKLKEITSKMSRESTNCKCIVDPEPNEEEPEAKDDMIAADEIPCIGALEGFKCKNPNCKGCKFSEEKKEEPETKSAPEVEGKCKSDCKNPNCKNCKKAADAQSTTSTVGNSQGSGSAKPGVSPKRSRISNQLAIEAPPSTKAVTIEEPPKDDETNCDYTGECPVMAYLSKKCDQCCQTSQETISENPRLNQESDQPKLKKKHKKTSCHCPKQRVEYIAQSQISQSTVQTADKKLQVHQFMILYGQQKAALQSVRAAKRNQSNRSEARRSHPICTTITGNTGRGTSRSNEISNESEDDTIEEEEEYEEIFYDCLRQPSPVNIGAIIPTRPTGQPCPASYKSYTRYYVPTSHQPSRIPQRTGYIRKAGIAYGSWYPAVNEGSHRSRSPLYGAAIRATRVEEYDTTDDSRTATPERKVSISKFEIQSQDPANRIIEAIMQNPTRPAYEALQIATELDIRQDEIDTSRIVISSDSSGTVKKKRPYADK